MAKDPEKKRIVITGVGVVAPNGIGKEEFWSNCFAGVSGIKPITLFDVSKYRCKYAGEISNFQPEKHLGPKGLRNLDRTTLLALVAAKLAIEDAHLEITDNNRDDIGVVLGSTMGSVHSISEFDKEGLREGPRYVNPAQFPNTVINSPASQVAIRFGLRGLNSTISTGFTASLDAIGYALDMLRLDRAKVLLVGGVEELCIQTFLGFYKLGFLATSQNGTPPRSAPFDAQSRGALLGEGCAFVILESEDDAKARGATTYAEILGYGTEFHPDSMYRYDPAAVGASHAIRHAFEDASVEPDDIAQVSASANASKAGDAMELTALRNVFGSRFERLPVQSVKSLLGESFSAAGLLQLVATIGAMARQSVPVAAGSPRGPKESREIALVESFGPTGSSSAIILAGPEV
jgi:3-oxoacyl-[acyl-carrier-protein] synthase II